MNIILFLLSTTLTVLFWYFIEKKTNFKAKLYKKTASPFSNKILHIVYSILLMYIYLYFIQPPLMKHFGHEFYIGTIRYAMYPFIMGSIVSFQPSKID